MCGERRGLFAKRSIPQELAILIQGNHLRADARLGVEALTAALPARTKIWRSDAMAARIRDSKPDIMVFEVEPGLLDTRDEVEELEKEITADWEIVN